MVLSAFICVHLRLKYLSKQPWLGLLVFFLKCPDLVGVLQRQADFVQAIQQAMLAVRRDVKAERTTVRRDHCLRFEIHVQTITLGGRAIPEQPVDDFGGCHHRQDAVLVAIAKENIKKK